MGDQDADRPYGWRLQYLWPALAATTAVVAVLVSTNFGSPDGRKAVPGQPTSTTGPSPGSTTPIPSRSVPPTSAAQPDTSGIILGRDLQAVTKEDCRSPGVGTGSSWQVIKSQVGARSLDYAYSCNLFAGSMGSLDFALGRGYTRLTLLMGFDNASQATGHAVRFELIGDGKNYLAEPVTLSLGNDRTVDLDVSQVTRLTLRITETGPPGGTGSSSRPVFAMPTLLKQ